MKNIDEILKACATFLDQHDETYVTSKLVEMVQKSNQMNSTAHTFNNSTNPTSSNTNPSDATFNNSIKNNANNNNSPNNNGNNLSSVASFNSHANNNNSVTSTNNPSQSAANFFHPPLQVVNFFFPCFFSLPSLLPLSSPSNLLLKDIPLDSPLLSTWYHRHLHLRNLKRRMLRLLNYFRSIHKKLTFDVCARFLRYSPSFIFQSFILLMKI